MEIIRAKLSPDALYPPYLRYDATANTVQQTADGGTTWVNAPALDPRHADTFRKQASTSGAAQCDAAARIVGLWKESLEGLYQTGNAIQFASTALAVGLALVPDVGILVDLFLIAGDVLVTLVVSDIEAAFTDAVWHGVQCIIDENISANGQVSATQETNILEAIATAYPGTIYNTLVELNSMFGEVLMSNAGVERTETGDCSTCTTCANKSENFTTYPNALTTIANATFTLANGTRCGGVYDATVGRTAPGSAKSNSVPPFTDAQQVNAVIDLGEGCTVTGVDMWALPTELNYNVYMDLWDATGAYIAGFAQHVSTGALAWTEFHWTASATNVRYIGYAAVTDIGQTVWIDDLSLMV